MSTPTSRLRFGTLGQLAAVALALALATVAGRALANSSAFAFTMNMRHVDGEKNKQSHALDAGDLTINGNVWVTSKRARATSTPESITFRVAETGLLGSTVCTVSVTPDTIFNSKRAFSKSCDRIKSGTYWIEVSKGQAIDKMGDGWQLQGSGTLTTK